MKRFFACFAVFAALIFVISCGGGSSKPADGGDTGETVTDEDSDTADSEPADDSEPSDTNPEDPDYPDITPDNGDTDPDNGDPTPDNDADSGDTAPDADDEEPINENPDNLPECSPTSATPCIDSEAENSDSEKTNLIWSGKSPERLRWIDAVDYCKNLNEGGYSDWQLPTLAALKTLVRTCGSDGYSDGECSKFGDIVFFWSSNQGYGVFFYDGNTQSKSVDENFDARCVRKEITSRQANCIAELPENAEWNSVPQITQAWSWETARWLPSQTGLYSEEPSTEECRFKCKENYFLDPDSGKCLNPCESNPCNAVAHSTHECKASTWYQYSCECNDGYYWHGKTEGCKTELVTLGNICTGQNRCYDTSSSMICPAKGEDFFGQDVQYAALGFCAPQSFIVQTISDQNVVLDNNTGLMWQQTIPWLEYEWVDAKNYCSNLEYAGYSDWRLPTPQELLTIVDNSKYNPAIDTAYFPILYNYSYFWSSSTCVYDTSRAWRVGSYGGGGVSYYIMTQGNYRFDNYVMCVRGEELPMASFTTQTISGDVIVTDTETGLIWQKTYVTGKTWQEALSYCESLTYAGYSDWRLPNKNELASLINYAKYDPASDFPDMPSQNFWSSSTGASKPSIAWDVSFNNGYVGFNDKTDNHNVRCVR